MKCYKRWQNKKSKKQEYIPLKELKGTVEYNRVMGKRNSTRKSTKSKKVNPIIKVSKANDQQKFIIDEVNRLMEVRNVKSDITKTDDVIVTLKLIKDLFCGFNEKKTQAFNAIGVLDLLECNLRHDLEHCEIYDDNYQMCSDRNYWFYKERRKWKDSYDAIDKLTDFASLIMSIPDFEQKIDETIEVMEKLKNDQDNPVYYKRVDTPLLSEGSVEKTNTKMFDVVAQVIGLYNQRTQQPFTRRVEASNEGNAKKMVNELIMKSFKNVKICGIEAKEVISDGTN